MFLDDRGGRRFPGRQVRPKQAWEGGMPWRDVDDSPEITYCNLSPSLTPYLNTCLESMGPPFHDGFHDT
jgi:hypothetical protein